MSDDHIKRAIRALRHPNGATADELKSLLGWRVKPGPGAIEKLANDRGFRVEQTVTYHVVPTARPRATG